VLIASLLNLDAVCAQLAGREDVLLVCAGTDGRVSMEDVYLAGRISAALEGDRTDAARIAESLAAAYPRPLDALAASGGAIGLRREGLESDIDFCAQESIVEVVGRLSAMVDGAALLTAAPSAIAPAAADKLHT
jgi:2-phosphosulfolactate phosphatase